MVSFNMLPLLASDNTPDGPAVDPEHLSDLTERVVALRVNTANSDHVLFSQNMVVVLFASALSPLGNHVIHVVLVRAHEQMFKVHARRIVAVMTDLHPVRNRPIRFCPHLAVRECRCSVHPGVDVSVMR